MMFITASIRYMNYDSKAIFMDGFYLAFTFYLYIFGVLLGTAEYEYIKVLKYIEFLVSNTGKGTKSTLGSDSCNIAWSFSQAPPSKKRPWM